MPSKYILVGALVVVVVGGAAVALFNKPESQGVSSPLATHFQEALFERGTADGLIPIEGFDAGLLLGEFSGLVPEDFEGVEGYEGVYYVQNGVVMFERTVAEPVSTAERTVSPEGYRTLLANVSARLGVVVSEITDVEQVVESLDQRVYLDATLGETVAAYGVRITPERVLEDSRCPSDVECVWAGTVRLETRLESGVGTATQTFTVGTPITTEAEVVTLVSVLPYPTTPGVTISPEEYRFRFEITKR